MRSFLIAFAVTMAALPACADTGTPSKVQPDPSRPVTLPLASVQRMMDAARAEGAAACLAQGVKPEIDDIIRQATPSEPKPAEPAK